MTTSCSSHILLCLPSCAKSYSWGNIRGHLVTATRWSGDYGTRSFLIPAGPPWRCGLLSPKKTYDILDAKSGLWIGNGEGLWHYSVPLTRKFSFCVCVCVCVCVEMAYFDVFDAL